MTTLKSNTFHLLDSVLFTEEEYLFRVHCFHQNIAKQVLAVVLLVFRLLFENEPYPTREKHCDTWGS